MYALIALVVLIMAFSLAVASSQSRSNGRITVEQPPRGSLVLLTVNDKFFSTRNNEYRGVDDAIDADVFVEEFVDDGGSFYLRERTGRNRYLSLSNTDAAEGVTNLRLATGQQPVTKWQRMGQLFQAASTTKVMALGHNINASGVSGNDVFAADKDKVKDTFNAIVDGSIYHVSDKDSKRYFNPKKPSNIANDSKDAVVFFEVERGDAGNFLLVGFLDDVGERGYLATKEYGPIYDYTLTTRDEARLWTISNGQPVTQLNSGKYVVPIKRTGIISGISQENLPAERVLFREKAYMA
jgi:hypothetical protein